MKRPVILALALILSGTVLFACSKKDPSAEPSSPTEATSSETTFEAQHKTEKKTVHVSSGLIPQVIDENVAAAPTIEESIKAESVTYIDDISFSELPSFSVTSKDVKDGHWDPKITNTKFGENMSPDLSWDKVEGASSYVVFMIDGDWLHMDVFTTETSIEEGAIKRAGRGARYVGPYPPWGTHTYSVFVFALKNEMGKIGYNFDAGGNDINKMYEALDIDANGNAGNVIAYGRLDGNYSHQD